MTKNQKTDMRKRLESMRVEEMAEWMASGRHGKESLAVALEIADATWGVELLIEVLRES